MEDVTSELLGGGDGQEAPQEPVAPEPEPQPQPEPFRLKYRGEERELPYEPVTGLAQALDTTPEGVINALQRAREADRIARENIAYRQRIEELENQARGATYQERMGGGQAPQPRGYREQHQPQHQYPQQHEPDVDDPIALLKAMRQELNMTQRQFNEFIEAARQEQEVREQQRQEAIVLQHGQQLTSQMERFLNEKNHGRREPIDIREFAEEVALSGGVNPHVPIEHAMERAWLWMTRDEQFQRARNEAIDALKQPRAVVTVPGTRSSGTPAAKPQSDNLDLSQIPLGKFSF